jgi:hypothetical protein
MCVMCPYATGSHLDPHVLPVGGYRAYWPPAYTDSIRNDRLKISEIFNFGFGDGSGRKIARLRRSSDK